MSDHHNNNDNRNNCLQWPHREEAIVLIIVIFDGLLEEDKKFWEDLWVRMDNDNVINMPKAIEILRGLIRGGNNHDYKS